MGCLTPLWVRTLNPQAHGDNRKPLKGFQYPHPLRCRIVVSKALNPPVQEANRKPSYS